MHKQLLGAVLGCGHNGLAWVGLQSLEQQLPELCGASDCTSTQLRSLWHNRSLKRVPGHAA